MLDVDSLKFCSIGETRYVLFVLWPSALIQIITIHLLFFQLSNPII